MRPTFRSLDRDEIDAVLRRHSVGRLAYVEGHGAQVEPIHYVFEDGWIFGRTQPGSKLTALAHRPWVAFEVDEVDGLFDWRSVVVRGALYFYAADDAAPHRAQYDRAVAAIRRLVPDAFTPDDPVPDRVVVFGLHADDATGRAAATSA